MKNKCVTRKSKNNRPCGFTRNLVIQKFATNPKNDAQYQTYKKVYNKYWKSLFVKTRAYNGYWMKVGKNFYMASGIVNNQKISMET